MPIRAELLGELLAWQPPVSTPIISNGILNPGQRMFLFGKYDTFKSMMAIQICFCVATGKEWLGYSTTPTPCLYIPLEGSKAELQLRVRTYAEHHLLYPNNFWLYHTYNMELDAPDGLHAVDALLTQTGAKLLIIDPLFKVIRSETDDTSAKYFVNNMDSMIQRHGCSIIIIAHNRKPMFDADAGVELDFGADDLRGVNTFARWADNIIGFNSIADDIVRLRFLKLKAAVVRLPAMELRFNRATLELCRVNNAVEAHE